MPTIDSAPPPPPQPLALLQGAFSGPRQFAQIIRDALAVAAQEGWSEMVWSDPDFESWPLREKAVADSLNGWAQRGRKLVLLASYHLCSWRKKGR